VLYQGVANAPAGLRWHVLPERKVIMQSAALSLLELLLRLHPNFIALLVL
jgi:hypothetical protein